MSTASAFHDIYSANSAGRPVLRRRPSPHQGRALEKLGHAVEYLIDSRMAMIDEPRTRADAEALDVLMCLSRSVFSECEEIIPVGHRLKRWITERFSER